MGEDRDDERERADGSDVAAAAGDATTPAVEPEVELLLTERDTDEGTLVAVCDADVLGETFENGEVSLTVEEEFYDGEAADPERVVSSLADCTTANLVGTAVVELAIEAGFVEEDNVLELEGTRHAQLLWM